MSPSSSSGCWPPPPPPPLGSCCFTLAVGVRLVGLSRGWRFWGRGVRTSAKQLRKQLRTHTQQRQYHTTTQPQPPSPRPSNTPASCCCARATRRGWERAAVRAAGALTSCKTRGCLHRCVKGIHTCSEGAELQPSLRRRRSAAALHQSGGTKTHLEIVAQQGAFWARCATTPL